MNERVRFELGDDHVGVVRLNRPEKLNALDFDMFTGLHDAAAEARKAIADGACRAVLLLGEGRAFCSGLDVSLFGEMATEALSGDGGLDKLDWLQQSFSGFEDLAVPTIAAWHGFAFGGGFQLGLAAHLRVATPAVRIALLEARWAIIPDLGATYRLPRIVGLGRATELAMGAREIDGATAEQWGLVNAVLPEDGFADAARAYAARLAEGPTIALGAIPQLMREGLIRQREDVMSADGLAQAACLQSADFQEAATAGLQGRQPVFKGA